MTESLSRARILCVGDLMLDRFVQGDVGRISQEAPVPVFRWVSERRMLGGAGNVIANLRALGATAALACRVGCDQEGEEAAALAAECGAELLAVRSSSLPTIQKTRFVAKGNHVLRMDREVVAPLSQEEEDELVSKIEARIADFDLVVLSDYAKGLLSRSFCERTIGVSSRAGKCVYVDPKGRDFRKYAGATLVKPNRVELEAACGVQFDASAPDFMEKVVAAARGLLADAGIKNAVVTLSERGMVYVPGGGGEAVWLPTECREVCDVTGAGDTKMSVLAAARAVGASFRDAMKVANAAAGVVVGKVGTATVSPEELKAAFAGGRSTPMSFEGKVMTLGELAGKVRSWQAGGLKVGFTNGCFDCLHCGHLSSFSQAKEHCDRLVVAVNSDSSVRRLKGPSRPVQDERTRTLVLAGLELVDAVVVFDGDTAMGVVEAIRPDVIAKEGYPIDKWPEARFVASYGGEAVTLKRVDGYSTSSLVGKLG